MSCSVTKNLGVDQLAVLSELDSEMGPLKRLALQHKDEWCPPKFPGSTTNLSATSVKRNFTENVQCTEKIVCFVQAEKTMTSSNNPFTF